MAGARCLLACLAAAAAAAAPPARLAAQGLREPHIVMAAGGGLVFRGGDLWRVNRQLVPSPLGGLDSVTLGRAMRRGPVVFFSFAWFQSPRLGTSFEAAYVALETESRCTAVDSFLTDPERINEQTCSTIQGRRVPTAALALQAGLVIHPVLRRAVQPYLRAAAGVALFRESFVRTEGQAQYAACATPGGICAQTLVIDLSRKEISLAATLAAGLSLDMGPGLRFQLEARDQMIAIPAVSSFRAPTASPALPVASRMLHIPVLTAGMELILVRRPAGRR